MNYRIMKKSDIPIAVELYMNYYNNHEDGEWTEETAYKRIPTASFWRMTGP